MYTRKDIYTREEDGRKAGKHQQKKEERNEFDSRGGENNEHITPQHHQHALHSLM